MEKILFIDEDNHLLQGLKRSLRNQRKQWQMDFVNNGNEALKKLETTTYSAIVTDLLLSGLNGCKLLNIVMNQYPDTVRIILSGYSDQETAIRATSSSHQYLAKPVEVSTLKNTLIRAFSMRNTLGPGKVRSFVSGIQSLPSLPNIYSEISEKTKDDSASINDIGNIILQDPGISIKLIQLVNSAYFGLPREITHPVDAISLLGLETTSALVLSIGVFKQFDLNDQSQFSLKQIWNDSVESSNYCKIIAQNETSDPETIAQAFLSGLLHNIGSLLLAEHFPNEYLQSIQISHAENISLSAAQKKVFNTNQAEIGAYLMSIWGISEPAVAAVAYQDEPHRYPTQSFSALTALYMSNKIIQHNKQYSFDEPINQEHIDTDYLKGLNLAHRISSWQILCNQKSDDTDDQEAIGL